MPQEKKPYRKAVLRHHNYDLSKRWYVEYYVYDESIDNIKRVRLFEPLNRKKSMNERLQTGEEMVRILNGKLYAGQYIRATGPLNPVKPQLRTSTMQQAIAFFIEEKRKQGCRINYIKNFQRLANHWEAWRAFSKTNDFHFQYLHEENLQQFFHYLSEEKKISRRAFNNYRSDMLVFLNYINTNFPRVIKKDLMRGIHLKRVVTSTRHAAFTDEQMKQIGEACRKMHYDQLLLMIYLIYYTLARPNELRQLKVQHIDLKQNRIFIPGSISKNWNDEYVYIPPALSKEIRRQNITSFPKHFYIFSPGEQPGEKMIYPQLFWKRNKEIIKHLDFTERRHDLYSYKHSGAISLYRSTKDIKLLQHACRHADINQTSNYLRELGVVDVDYFKLDAWKGAL